MSEEGLSSARHQVAGVEESRFPARDAHFQAGSTIRPKSPMMKNSFFSRRKGILSDNILEM
jgi:hypothetical protein